jgi:phage terminase large subunit GpA-like protein
MRITAAGPGCMHFSQALPATYFEQLTAERLVTRYLKGRPKLEWVKPAGRRNEALDLEVYALAAAYYLGLHRHTELHWQALEQRLRQPDLLAQDHAQPEPDPAAPAGSSPHEPPADTIPTASSSEPQGPQTPNPSAQPPKPAPAAPLPATSPRAQRPTTPRRKGFATQW